MTKRQRIFVYGITLFLMIWGLDVIRDLKLNRPLSFLDFFNSLYLSHLIYAGATLLLMHYICRRFFLPKKYWQFVLAVIGIVLFFIFLRYSIEEMLYPVLINSSNYPETASFLYYVLDNIYFALVYIGMGFLLFLLDMQIGNQKKQALLIQQNKEAELQFLRSQVNPHFLFNTLNNIYSLVYDRSPKAPSAMLQLSELMRYVLYEKKETVPVNKEWTYIQNFITLQKLRFDHDIALQLTLEGAVDSYLIPPYLLIPFIENAFKHGDLQNDPLKIRLQISGGNLLFETSNRVGHRNKDEAGGIGLDSVKRRLELLYPGRYELDTKTENGLFSARLLILPG